MILLVHVPESVVCVCDITMYHLHYIIAGVTKDSSLMPGVATQVTLDTYTYPEHTHTCMYTYICKVNTTTRCLCVGRAPL